METLTHKSTVQTEIVCSKDGKNTFEITKTLSDVKGEKAIIVLLYPTRNQENINSEDSTLNHIVSHMKDFDFSEVKIINLFSKVVNGRMSSRGLQVDTENMKYIEETVFSDKDLKDKKFIVAWGNSMESSAACNESKKKIIEMYLSKLPKGKVYQIVCPERGIVEGSPHPLFLGIRAKDVDWKLLQFDTKSILKEKV